ncbi:MFS transporter [Rhizosaccharibacter radicis]|uniref:MFS transporter n=1 Tax=Rhizosaccharibacter radicis TaxID=2782605 RepID=A0ABT1VUR4_9PROT|nr:MFS transporter [Acetobacteraceae bacterium KSS12]
MQNQKRPGAGPGVVPGAGQIAAVAAGNGLEFYDFVTYSFFAVQIGHCFFPHLGAEGSLLASLATFGVGFLFRPLGAWAIGRVADRRGRRPAMLLSFALIGVSVTGLALTPSYRSIGPAAPVLAIGFRMLQGFALGGEVGPSTAFLLEAAPPERRGLFTALQAASADAAVLVAGLVGILLSFLTDAAGLERWGWRAALLLGAAAVPFGLLMRRTIGETLHGGANGNVSALSAAPGLPVDRVQVDRVPVGRMPVRRVAVLGLAMLAAATIGNYTLDYLTTFAEATLHLSPSVAFRVTVIVGGCGVACDLLGGWLSDRLGRRPVLLVPGLLLLLLLLPAFALLDRVREPAVLLGMAALLSCCMTLSNVSMIVTIAEALPRGLRARGLGLIYAVSISVFGGSAQLVIACLVHWTGSAMAPGFYMFGAVALGLLAAWRLPETAPGRGRLAAALPAPGLAGGSGDPAGLLPDPGSSAAITTARRLATSSRRPSR